jgi:class 3 adenylate cyclase/pimeloyl-ACP methyl ester carboxylesterase
VTVDVEYAHRGDISIAFQAVGAGPLDIILGCGLVSHLDLLWADPHTTAFLRRLGALGRLLLFDKPGTGLSDPVVGIPSLEQRVGDFLAVLDAAGSRRAVVIGYSEAATPAVLLAATHPDRVEALVLLSGMPRWTSGPDFLPDEEDYIEGVVWSQFWHSADHWGDGTLMMALSPFVRGSALYRRLAPTIERACASPGMTRALFHSARSYDATGVLDAVRVPTAVIHRTDEFVPVSAARYTAERIDGARLVELPGDEHIHFFGGDDVLEEIGRFVGGHLHTGVSERKLTTLLFTDIVDSTATAAQLGDERWESLLARHDELASGLVERHDGRLIKTLGDGIFACFDRPLFAIRCALAIRDAAADLGMGIRAGVHTGECDLVHGDLAGIAVHIGARIAALAKAADVLVSSTVRDLVFGSGVEFAERGEHELKGVPRPWEIYAVVDDRSEDQRPAKQASAEEAALTPPPSATMRPFDRAAVGFANRTPVLTRAGLCLFGRIRSRHRSTETSTAVSAERGRSGG